MRILIVVLSITFAVSAGARLGDTPIQFADRYGKPKDTPQDKSPSPMFSLLEGAVHHTYEYQGWKIRAAFLQLDSPAVRVDYSKIPVSGGNQTIQDYELEAIAAANTPAGTSWSRIEVTNPSIAPTNLPARFFQKTVSDATGERMWQRTDGAILWLRGGKLIVRLELPAARQYEEQLKATKERKARASVPTF